MTDTIKPKDGGVALVTGAGRGIGRAIAYALAEAGFALVINDLNDNADLAETVKGVEAFGVPAAALPGDIADLAAHACVYRKPKPGRSGDEVRQGWSAI